MSDNFDYPLGLDGQDLSFDSVNDTSFTTSFGTAGAAESVQTISPEQLFLADPSPAFTNLTTPDMGPGSTFFSPVDSSPYLDNGGLDASASWPSLFSDADAYENIVEAPPMNRNISANTLASSGSSNGSPMILNASNRRKNSSPPGQSMALTAGVGQRRRRTKPLMDIEVDPNDAKAVKRARNTLAARDSRARKMNHIDTLEAKVKRHEAIMQRMQDELRARGYNGDLLEDVEDL